MKSEDIAKGQNCHPNWGKTRIIIMLCVSSLLCLYRSALLCECDFFSFVCLAFSIIRHSLLMFVLILYGPACGRYGWLRRRAHHYTYECTNNGRTKDEWSETVFWTQQRCLHKSLCLTHSVISANGFIAVWCRLWWARHWCTASIKIMTLCDAPQCWRRAVYICSPLLIECQELPFPFIRRSRDWGIVIRILDSAFT